MKSGNNYTTETAITAVTARYTKCMTTWNC